LDSISNEVIQLNSEIKNIINHSFVLKYIDQPAINDDMIAVMVKIMRNANVDQKLIPYYIVSVILMQIALETHETVSNSEEGESPVQLRQRQLSILAGDYYSSMYYHILAKTKDIEFISLMSKGIQEINEAKVRLYLDKDADIDQLVTYLCKIETILVEKTAEYFADTEQKDLYIDMLLMNRLLAELDGYKKKNHRSNFIKALQSIHIADDESADKISYLLNHEIKKVKERLSLSLLRYNSKDDLAIRIKGILR
jgi:heptaprenyl diphosphate synthase